MYFLYFDESGSRDPSAGTVEKPKDQLYVLLAVGMYEGQWRPFETEIAGLKLELAGLMSGQGKGRFELADLLAYSVYRAFKDEDLGYPYFERVPGTSPGGGREPRSTD